MCCLTYTGKNETFTTVEIGTKCGKVKNKIQNHCLLWKALSIYAIKISQQNHYIFTTLLCHEFSPCHNFVSISTVVI